MHFTIADHLLSLYEDDAALISLLHVDHLEAVDYDSVDEYYRVTFNARAQWRKHPDEESSEYKNLYIILIYDYAGGEDYELLEILFQYDDDDDDDYVPLRYTSPLTMRIFNFYETLLVQFLDAIGVR